MFGAKFMYLNHGTPIWATANGTLHKLAFDNLTGYWLLAMNTNSRIVIFYKDDMKSQNGILYWTLIPCEINAKFVSESWFTYDTVHIIIALKMYLFKIKNIGIKHQDYEWVLCQSGSKQLDRFLWIHRFIPMPK